MSWHLWVSSLGSDMLGLVNHTHRKLSIKHHSGMEGLSPLPDNLYILAKVSPGFPGRPWAVTPTRRAQASTHHFLTTYR